MYSNCIEGSHPLVKRAFHMDPILCSVYISLSMRSRFMSKESQAHAEDPSSRGAMFGVDGVSRRGILHSNK